MSKYYEYPRYEGDSAAVAALCIEMALSNLESLRRIGKGPDGLHETWESKDTVRMLKNVIWENRASQNAAFLRRFSLYHLLLLENKLAEEKATCNHALNLALSGKARTNDQWPSDLKAYVALSQAREGLGFGQVEVPYGRINNIDTPLAILVRDSCDLLERGFPIAAWDVLATTTREKRQEALDELAELGATPWDWIAEIDGFERCVLCDSVVKEEWERLELEHTSHCPQTNLDFGFKAGFNLLPLDRVCGIRRQPFVIGGW